jgi:hypothetical protein
VQQVPNSPNKLLTQNEVCENEIDHPQTNQKKKKKKVAKFDGAQRNLWAIQRA